MDIETEFRLSRLKLRIKRYKYFDWNKYFLKTFCVLLLFFIIMLITIPDFFIKINLITLIAINLWIMLLVCSILTQFFYFWYKFKYVKGMNEFKELKKLKKKLKKTKITK